MKGPLASKRATASKDKRVELQKAQYDADLRAVMGTPAGRRLLWRLINDTTGTFSGSFTGNSETFYREGRRAVGVFLLDEVKRVASADWVHMLIEAQKALEEQIQQRELDEREAETDDT